MENRYTYKVAADYLHINPSTLQGRARKLGINGRCGSTAADIKKIGEYETEHPGRAGRKTTIEQLRNEMEELTHE